jgi:hypothetical protein
MLNALNLLGLVLVSLDLSLSIRKKIPNYKIQIDTNPSTLLRTSCIRMIRMFTNNANEYSLINLKL